VKAFVITLHGHEYSERVADRCIASANIPVEKWRAVDKVHALEVMGQYSLRWTWDVKTLKRHNLTHHEYGGSLETRVGCAMSHYLLWRHCVLLAEPILILEHDAVFVRPFREFSFKGICQINDPRGATKRGAWWSDQMEKRHPGVYPKTRVLPDDVPDGLAGGSAYCIKPHAAKQVIEKVHDIGLWPNDATICRQFFELEELWPPITEVRQEQSTTNV
jgi:GR25 family glycosyltransferase involved in LPS biosynthesis